MDLNFYFMHSGINNLSYKAVVLAVKVSDSIVTLQIRYKKRSLYQKGASTVYIVKGDSLFSQARNLRMGDEVKADPMMDDEIMHCLPCLRPKRLFNVFTYKIRENKTVNN